jgi:hypothetical protein
MIAAASAASPVSAQDRDAQGWYAEGIRALTEGRFVDARAALLRVVEADPSFAGAWLDLALAAHGAGNIPEAEEFLSILEARYRLPEAIAAGVQSLRAQIRANEVPQGWHWRRVAQGGLGYDSNANAGLAGTDITLTFPTGGVPLPVADALRPRADFYGVTSLSVDGTLRQGDGQIEVGGLIKGRRNASVREFDSLDVQGSLGYTSNSPAFDGAWSSLFPGPWRLGASYQHLRLGGNSLLNSVSFKAVHAWSAVRCAPQGSAEVDLRTFPSARNLDSRLFWVGATVSCPTAWWGGEGGWTSQFRAGHEGASRFSDATQGRPGGNTWHLEAGLSHHWVWGPQEARRRIEFLVQWAGARDTQGYSVLLASNARRRVSRSTAGAAYTFPVELPSLDAGWTGTLTVQAFQQRSNLELFRLRGGALQFSVQRAF